MINFEFQNETKILFGRDTENNVGQNVVKYSKNILFLYGGGSIKKIGLYDKVVDSLKQEEVSYTELSGVVANPRLSLVYEGIKICKEKNIDFILAVGGGSVIDTAKAIACGVFFEGDVWDIISNRASIERMLPIGTILTIPAAGSESSDSAVITNEELQLKLGFGSPLMRPKFSILNPELTFTLPNYQTACGCMDIMAHTMERYFTNEDHVEITDRFCESLLKTIINNLPIALKDNTNYDARAEIMWSGTLAHNNMLGTGRIEDWANHGMEHEISAFYDIAHGAGLAITYPAWMRYISKKNPKKLLQFVQNVLDIDVKDAKEEALTKGIEKFESFLKECGLPIRLKDAGINDEKIELMAERCTGNNSWKIGNYVKLGKEEVLEIYKLAL
jgi:alcohol dehydrogenase YqhD (iron-dependent ADH family)